jgi:putative endonuclease
MGVVSQALGSWGEDVAVAHLQAIGMQVIDRRWRCAVGEIDIVARHGAALVVIEVKTRSGLGFGSPVESVTRVKVARLRRLAAAWLSAHEEHATDVRLDVVGVLRCRGTVCVEHLQGVV